MKTTAGEATHPFGPEASGYLTYTSQGYMAVTIMQAGRPHFATLDIRAGSLEEKSAAFETYLSYCGAFEVLQDRIIHRVEFSLFPNWSGADQVRFYEFAEDRLILRTPPVMIEGQERVTNLTWQRAPGVIPSSSET